MRGGAVSVLVGLTALGAYALGRHDAPTAGLPSVTISVPSTFTKPIALVDAPPDAPPIKPLQPLPSPSTTPKAKAAPPLPSPQPETQRKVEVVLTAAAIAAIIVKASRDQYYATGHPCACPEDRTRAGRRCGGNSAYSRPGGAAPLCYPTDISEAMIEDYRKTASASR
jgi:hypothetical protein